MSSVKGAAETNTLVHSYTLILFTDYITFFMFAAAFPDSQNSTDGIGRPRRTGRSHGSRWCWWHQRSTTGHITESQVDQEQVGRTGKLTNFTRLRLEIVSNDPAERERGGAQSTTLTLMISVVKHTHKHEVICTCWWSWCWANFRCHTLAPAAACLGSPRRTWWGWCVSDAGSLAQL